jgi:hypothetical protein
LLGVVLLCLGEQDATVVNKLIKQFVSLSASFRFINKNLNDELIPLLQVYLPHPRGLHILQTFQSACIPSRRGCAHSTELRMQQTPRAVTLDLESGCFVAIRDSNLGKAEHTYSPDACRIHHSQVKLLFLPGHVKFSIRGLVLLLHSA